MDILVDRRWKKDTYTIGDVYIDGTWFSNSLEDRDRGLSQDMPLSQIKALKVYGQTAIPTGRYEIQMTYSPKFASRQFAKKYQGKVLQIMDVKGYSGVRIHPFNSASESYGCVAVGRNLEKGKVLQSTAHYLRLLEDHVLPAMKRGEKIWLTIK